MKLVLYNADKIVVGTWENINSPKINDNNVEWEGGSLEGINFPFLLLDNDISVSDVVTDEIIAADIKDKYQKVDLQKRLEAAEMAIVTLMDFM